MDALGSSEPWPWARCPMNVKRSSRFRLATFLLGTRSLKHVGGQQHWKTPRTWNQLVDFRSNSTAQPCVSKGEVSAPWPSPLQSWRTGNNYLPMYKWLPHCKTEEWGRGPIRQGYVSQLLSWSSNMFHFLPQVVKNTDPNSTTVVGWLGQVHSYLWFQYTHI